MKNKKIIYLLLLSCFIFVVASCSNKKDLKNDETEFKREVSSEIDDDLVEQLVGTWRNDATANYPAQKTSTIHAEDGYIFFEDEKLQITSTNDNQIFSQTDEEEPFYYDFKIDKNKLTVYPSYLVPKGYVGGSLAPMEYIKDETLVDISMIVGDWESVEESETYYISIEKNSNDSIFYADNLEKKDRQLLKMDEISNDAITALTEDESSRYSFIISNENEITAFMAVNPDYYTEKGEEIPVGMSKPTKYRKIIK